VDAVDKGPNVVGRCLKRQPGLADATRADETHKSAIGIRQQISEFGQFLLATDKGCRRGGQMVRQGFGA
jgi:hypothetical protein